MSRGVFVHVCVMYRFIVKMTTTRPSCPTEYGEIMALIYELQKSLRWFHTNIFKVRLYNFEEERVFVATVWSGP